jgi:lipoprotein LprG
MTARLCAIVALVLAAGLVTGCSSSKKPSQSPTKVLAAAKKNLDTTTGVRIGLATDKLPSGVNGLLSAQGVGTHAPAFKGGIKVVVSGVTADASVVAVNDVVYAKLPFTAKFVKIDPSDYGAPDPAALLRPEGGLSSLLTEAKDVTTGDQVRQGKQVLTTYSATVPGKAVAAVIPSADATASFDGTFTVDDHDQLAKVVLTGPFYPKGGDVTYTVTFEDYGVTQHITAP